MSDEPPLPPPPVEATEYIVSASASELAAEAINAEVASLPINLIVPPPLAGPATTRTSLNLLTLGREGAKQAAQVGNAIPERFGDVGGRQVSMGSLPSAAVNKANLELYQRVQAYDKQNNATATATAVNAEPLQPLFRMVIFEYLRVMDRANPTAFAVLYQKVLDALVSSESNLKTVVTVDLWERARKYISEFQLYEAMQAVGSTTAPLPVLFLASDWPEASDEGNQYAVLSVTESGGIHLDRMDLVELTVHNDSAVSKALGMALKHRPLEEVTDSGLHWHTFHVARLTDANQELLANGDQLPQGRPAQLEPDSRNVSVDSDGGKNKNGAVRRASKARHSMIPQDKRKYIEGEPLELDVKFGRGGGTNNHKGNILYLLKKLSMQPAYALLATSRGKTIISMQLVAAVQQWGGRFVAKSDDGRWFEVDLATARRKASQTLREDKTPAEQEQKRMLLQRKLDEIEVPGEPSNKRRKTSLLEKAAGETLLQLQSPAQAKEEEEENENKAENEVADANITIKVEEEQIAV